MFAGSKEDAARDLLAKSFQQTNLWTDGAVQLIAKVRMPRQKGEDLNLTYEISWAGPDKWRAEWSGAGYSQIAVLNNGKMYRSSNLPAPPLRVFWFEEALAALNPDNLVGLSFAPHLDLNKSKAQVSTEKVGKTKTTCVGSFPVWCVDPGSGRLLRFKSPQQSSDYEDYVSAGEAEFPRSLRLMSGSDIQAEGTIAVNRGVTFSDSLFSALPNSTAADFPSCAGTDKSFTAPRLIKQAQPVYPETARMSRHQGSVLLFALVGKDGAIQDLQVVSSAWPELNQAASDAVRQWRYSPYLRCGQSVDPYATVITVNFTLSGSF